jgi:hypothetical protein
MAAGTTRSNRTVIKENKTLNFSLEPLDEQVMVITGASSGIGLVTAKHAADHGAFVVLAARNEQ